MLRGELIETEDAAHISKGGDHEYTQKLIGALPSAAGPRKTGLLPEPVLCPSSDQPLLDVRQICKVFPLSGWFKPKLLKAVDNISFTIQQGEIVSLVGESGSGKSTIARLIARLVQPTSGSILLDGIDILSNEPRAASLQYRKRVQMVFQDPFGSLNSVHTVFHHLARPLLRHRLVSKSELYDYIIQMLETVELTPGAEFADKFPHRNVWGRAAREWQLPGP